MYSAFSASSGHSSAAPPEPVSSQISPSNGPKASLLANASTHAGAGSSTGASSSTFGGPGSGSSKKFRRSASGKLVRDMLEHSVICTAPVRQHCSECKELRAALVDHASRCTRIACSMPFCGVKKNPKALQVLEDDDGDDDQEIVVRRPDDSALANPSVASTMAGKAPLQPAGLPDRAPYMVQRRDPPPFLGVRPPIGRAGMFLQPVPKAEEDPGVGDEGDEEGTEDEIEPIVNETGEASTTGSAVTMTGTFDGRMTFHGRWYYDVSPSIVSDFGYVFKGDDVSDPDGSLPCFACKKPGAHTVSGSTFIVCDLCDQVFHLECAKLESIPQQVWYCEGCAEIRSRLLPASLSPSIRLPPTRSWAGFFLLGEKRIAESFRLEFDWRKEPDADGIIASVKGKGKNSFGPFTISGKLAQPVPPKTSFALTLAKTYDG